MKRPTPQKAESSALNSINFIGSGKFLGVFPKRRNTVTAEILSHLMKGETLTGMDAVFSASTTRLSGFIFTLKNDYDWTIEHVDVNVGTKDGRIAFIRAYYLPRTTIRQAFNANALEFCRSVDKARTAIRKQAPIAKAKASKRNATRFAAKFNPYQGCLFAEGAYG